VERMEDGVAGGRTENAGLLFWRTSGHRREHPADLFLEDR